MIADDPNQWNADGEPFMPVKKEPYGRQCERSAPGYEAWVRETSGGNIDIEIERIRRAGRL